MNELNKLFEALYNDFLLRDLFAKIVPGAIVLLSFLFTYDDTVFINSFEKLHWGVVLIFTGICWVFGFGIQKFGELTNVLKHHPEKYNDSKFRYELRNRFTNSATDKAKKQIERFAVIKESTGNVAMALLIVIFIQLLHEFIPNKYVENMSFVGGITFLLISASLLILSNRSHAKKHYDFMESAISQDKINTKVVVFDFDGVLIDSMSSQEKAWKSAINLHSSTISKDQENIILENFWSGKAGKAIFDDTNIDTDTKQKLRGDKDRIWNDMKLEIQLMDGAIKTLHELKSNFKLAIASTASKSYINYHLKKNNISDLFSIVITDEDVDNPKPNPDMLEHIRVKMEVSEKNIIMIGDTLNDLKMAENANVDFILFQNETISSNINNVISIKTWEKLKSEIISHMA